MWPCDLLFEFVNSKKAQSKIICLAVAVHAQKLNSSTAVGFLVGVQRSALPQFGYLKNFSPAEKLH